MKKMLFAVTTILCLLAQAEVKPEWSFKPSLCSVKNSDAATVLLLAIETVCVGTGIGISGRNFRIELSLNDNTKRVYHIVFDGQLGGLGQSRGSFKGQDLVSDDEISGVLIQTNGVRQSHNIVLETNSNLKFEGALEPVMATP